MKATVLVRPKPGILGPQGEAVGSALGHLGFAVKDSSGHCAGGDIEADAAGTYVQSAQPVDMPRHAACTGDEAAKLAGHGG